MAALPDSFFTAASFGTLASSVVITTVVTNGLYKAIGWAPEKTGLAVAFLVILAGLYFSGQLFILSADIIGFFNAFLVYLTAAGISGAAGSKFRGGNGFTS